jgi:hypothetical protein
MRNSTNLNKLTRTEKALIKAILAKNAKDTSKEDKQLLSQLMKKIGYADEFENKSPSPKKKVLVKKAAKKSKKKKR